MRGHVLRGVGKCVGVWGEVKGNVKRGVGEGYGGVEESTETYGERCGKVCWGVRGDVGMCVGV